MSTEAVQNLTGTGYTETVELEGQRGLDQFVVVAAGGTT
jgi:hypothetical protein